MEYIKARSARGDRQQGHSEACKPLHYSEVSWEGQRCGSGEVDREFIRLMTGNLGEVEMASPTCKVSIFLDRLNFQPLDKFLVIAVSGGCPGLLR
jgi:hypothetical protein